MQPANALAFLFFWNKKAVSWVPRDGLTAPAMPLRMPTHDLSICGPHAKHMLHSIIHIFPHACLVLNFKKKKCEAKKAR